MFSAGEVSGDLHGATLAKEIRKINKDVEFIAFGGRHMEESGVRLLFSMEDYSVMGVYEVVVSLRKLLYLLDALTKKMKEEKPDLLVIIDYPDFNWRLAKRAKKLGIPVFSYIPPSAWAWRKSRAKTCAKIADELVTIFPFELKVYQEAGANISFVGNPLVDTVKRSLNKEEARKFFNLKAGEFPIVLLPGSRKQEIKRLYDIFLLSAKKILAYKENAVFYLPVAHGIDEVYLHKVAEKHSVSIRFTKEYTYDLFSIAKFALATSGTVVLEAALMGLTSIVCYKMSPFSYLIGKMLVNIEFFSLPNILAGKKILPELLQNEVTPANILQVALPYFEDANLTKIEEQLANAMLKLGEKGASTRVAQKILSHI